jgi:hypothetical protein
VSEFLGALGDNQLSPEFLQDAKHLLKRKYNENKLYLRIVIRERERERKKKKKKNNLRFILIITTHFLPKKKSKWDLYTSFTQRLHLSLIQFTHVQFGPKQGTKRDTPSRHVKKSMWTGRISAIMDIYSS